MLANIGEIFLILAAVLAFLQGTLPLIGVRKANPYFLATARVGAIGQCLALMIAYAALTLAFARDDFSLVYVAANSHPLLPWMYKLTAVWGGHEGSILLWVLVLNIWTFIFYFLANRQSSFKTTLLKLQAPTLAIIGLISFCLLLFILGTSNPFITAEFPIAPKDLNPLLQDPGFVIHPPILYMGYVGLTAAYALTIAALMSQQLNTAWVILTKQLTTIAWCFLTIGIALGSWWSYRVLGWGGFWFWDPVENASLMPWFAATALIHVLAVVEKRNIATAWAVLLTIICFALSLLGTFLVRSGVLMSVHNFSSDPKRGVYLLLFVGIILTLSLVIFIWHTPAKKNANPIFWRSREASLLMNSGFMTIALLTILLGTLYPLILDSLNLNLISVGAPYFNKALTPLVIVTLAIMGFAPLCYWQTKTLQMPTAKIILHLVASIVLTLVCAYALNLFNPLSLICLALSIWILLNLWPTFKINLGMSLAHLGVVVFILGIVFSSTLSLERNVKMQPGDIVDLGPYQFLFVDTKGINGSNYRGIQAMFEVLKNDRHVASMFPQKLIYTVRDMVMTRVAIQPGIFRDLYIGLGEPLDDNYWSVRLYYKPFIRWIWFGAAFMVLGGICSLLPKRVTPIKNNKTQYAKQN